MKTMQLVCLFVVLALVGSAQAALYSENFDTDPGWTYVNGGRFVDAQAEWDSNGYINGTWWRTNTDDYNLNVIYTDLGVTLTEAFDWHVSYELQELSGYKIAPASGLVDSIPTTASSLLSTQQGIWYTSYSRYNSGQAHMRIADSGGHDYSTSVSPAYTDNEWYTVEFDWNATAKTLNFKVTDPIEGVTLNWTRDYDALGQSPTFSLDKFAMWDYGWSGAGETQYDSNQYLDDIVITPEPTTVVLLGLGSLALLRKRKSA